MSPRRSFAARLLAAFMGAVALLLVVMLLVVRAETDRQVREVTREAVERAEAAFREADEQRLALLAEAAPFTRGVRGVAAVQAAIAGGDFDELVEDFLYEFRSRGIPPEEVLLAFADPSGAPVLTLIQGERPPGDPASLRPLFERLVDGREATVDGYRMIEGLLYRVQARTLFEGPRLVGTVAFGFPIRDAYAAGIGRIVGVEVCFVGGGRCVAGTPDARGALAAVLAGTEPGEETTTAAGGARWRVVSAPLEAGRPDQGRRAIAVPMEAVLVPFERISRTLLLSGLLALLVALLASISLARGLTRPVRALVEATGRVARGDYEAEVEVDREDEMGALAAAFNEMTRGLRLKERYRGVLDKVVSREVADELVRGDLVLGGETRRATVLFADLRGFTSRTEGMEPHSVIALLNECMETLSGAVDTEGGIVDKYVGDELMAVWGAPVARPDDPLRAVRAALGMQRGMEELNRRRAGRGEEPIGVGIGVNTGEVVAGNMGSAARLNYTVLGEPVNLAARLCSAAGPGEVLVGPETAEAVADAVPLEEAGPVALKGFSREVRVHRPVATVAGLALLGLFLGAPRAAAQSGGELPTLEGAAWISEDGRFQLLPSGRLDLEAYVPSDDPAFPILPTRPFLAPRLRLFLDAFAGDRLYGLLELRADRGQAPSDGDLEARVEQAFVRLSAGAGVQVQAGRFASPFGGYGFRHLSPADPFVRPPLPYEHPTTVCPSFLPGSTSAFVAWQDEPLRFRPLGVPPVWNVPYQWGAMVSGAAGPIDLRGAWMNGSPSSAPHVWGWDAGRLADGSVVLGAGLAVSPALRVDLSWSVGPYLEPGPGGAPLPPGRDADAYDQELWGLEAVWKRGPSVVRGEVLLDRWEVPNVDGDAREASWYVEAQRDLLPGLFGAVRLAGMDFATLTDEAGATRDWDRDLLRFEVGAGYRVVRNLEVRGQVGLTRSDGADDPADDLVSLQAWWTF